MPNNCLPNFLLVGAMKSGTTSMYHYLNEHPQIYLPSVKEPMFFSSSALLKIDNFKYKFQKHCTSAPYNSIDDYKSLYSNVKNEIAIGESSPHYLFTYETTIPLIKKYLNDIKIILILRNPVDRSYSAYKHNRRQDPNAPYLHEKLSFIDALKAEHTRFKKGNYPMMFYYKSMSMYYNQVKSYKDNFSQVLVCKYDELESDPLLLMKKIYTFLEVDHSFIPNVEIKYNVARIKNINFLQKTLLNINKRKRWNIMQKVGKIIGNHNLKKLSNILIKEDKSTPDEYCRIFLINEIREDILKLENLINEDLQDWLK